MAVLSCECHRKGRLKSVTGCTSSASPLRSSGSRIEYLPYVRGTHDPTSSNQRRIYPFCYQVQQ